MAGLRAAAGTGLGFDPDRNRLLIPAKKTSDIILVAGKDLVVSVDDRNIADWDKFTPVQWMKDGALSPWEKSQNTRGLRVTGKSIGSTVLHAKTPDGFDFVAPLTINVIPDPEYRNGGETVVSDPLGAEMRAAKFRDALVMLARDQMYSAIGRSPHGGNGRYGIAKGQEWCGGFVHWVYTRTAATLSAASPFGDDVNTLASPQKAIGWALHNTSLATIIRYQGSDPYGWSWGPGAKADKTALNQDFIDISANNPVQTGDVALYRDKSGWRHVCMVVDPPAVGKDDFTTIDGNQTGAFRPDGASQECIGMNSHNASDKLPDGKSYKWVFLHMTGI
jgi:hypothetical protein